jgi:hypothetical protein
MVANNFLIGIVLLQQDDKVYPVAFYFKKIISTELDFNIHDKEILAIISNFNEWRSIIC